MKKIFLLLAAFLLSFAPAKAAELLTGVMATSCSKVVDGWTYITSAAEFMKLVSECQSPDVAEKKVKLACDIEYPEDEAYYNIPTYYIKYFNGVFDGMGCTITFRMKSRPQYAIDVAFIQELKGSGSEVRNLKFSDCSVESHSSGRVMALVVAKVTATGARIHDIYVDGSSIYGYHEIASMGGLICQINSDTQIDHCAFDNCDIYWEAHERDTVGIICNEYIAGANNERRYISDCYITATPRVGPLLAKFSCLRELTGKEINNGVKKYPNCYYTEDCSIKVTSDDFTNNLTKITVASLKSGSSVLGEGWKYDEDALPLPDGLFYWNPNKTYDVNVGTYGTSQTLTGRVTPIGYGRFIDATPLKLTGINYNNKTSYVINDNITNEIGVSNRITAIGENVFQYKEMTSLQLPASVTDVEGTSFHHSSEGFVSNGNWRSEGNLLYLNTDEISRLITAAGSDNTELTINCRYCNSILDEALKGQRNLKNLYVNTWFPVDHEGTLDPIELLGDDVFAGCPTDMNVYIKDGTVNKAIIGEEIDDGYKNPDTKWSDFYDESEDVDNHLFQYFPVSRNPAGVSTLMLGYPVALPSDCSAWIATGIYNEDGMQKLALQRVQGNVVPAELPVLLSYEQTSGVMHLTPYENYNGPAATAFEGNLFKGSIDPAGQKIDPSEMMTNVYTLSRLAKSDDWSTVAFRPFHPVDGILPSYIAYISNNDVPHAKLAMVFQGDYDFPEDEVVTGISETDAQHTPNSSSMLRYHRNETTVYNLNGQRVDNNYRGLIIKNGRKYIAK